MKQTIVENDSDNKHFKGASNVAENIESYNVIDSSPIGRLAMKIGDAFRGAIEKDAVNICDLSSRQISYFGTYYLISRLWMAQMLSYISSCKEFEKPGKINNVYLLEKSSSALLLESSDIITDPVIASRLKYDYKNPSGQKGQINEWFEQKLQSPHQSASVSLKKNLVHNTDYVIVGENVWKLVEKEFGFDFELPVYPNISSCKGTEKIGLSSVDVLIVIYPDSFEAYKSSVVGSYVRLPKSFKFEYSANNSNDLVSNSNSMVMQNLSPITFADKSLSERAKFDIPSILVLTKSDTSFQKLMKYSHIKDSPCSNTSFYSASTGMDLSIKGIDNTSFTDSYKMKRRTYGSGLGNLGNTCFMNSTLQCLAHTAPLRKYFLSQQYLNDLNKDNPLGTGGELAIEFSELLSQMWGTFKNDTSDNNSFVCSRNVHSTYSSCNHNSTSSVVYPRRFKYTLGKHAEQFVGYDQHDSQELATYLLDALHEDTNRVSKKPYIEYPEQGEEEPDINAANKAWNLHLKRENSRVLDNFMGQMKSRVQCPCHDCNRVSTTFDPFMYLSVPVPGIVERILSITFVPMSPNLCQMKMKITLNKKSTVFCLKQEISIKFNEFHKNMQQIDAKDICLVDIWHGEVFSYFSDSDEINKIRDSDITYAFEISSVDSLIEGQPDDTCRVDDEDLFVPEIDMRNSQRLILDLSTITMLNEDNNWEKYINKYMRQLLHFSRVMSQRASYEERISFYKKICDFIYVCYGAYEIFSTINDQSVIFDCAKENSNIITRNLTDYDISVTGSRGDEGNRISYSKQPTKMHPSACKEAQTLEEISASSSIFIGVNTARDVAILEFCSRKFYQFAMSERNTKRNINGNGAEIEIVLRKRNKSVSTATFHNESSLSTPFVLRISPSLTVFELRKLLEYRFSRFLKSGNNYDPFSQGLKGDTERNLINNKEIDDKNSSINMEPKVLTKNDASVDHNFDNVIATNSMDMIRKIPLTYERKSIYSYSSRSSPNQRLDAISKLDDNEVNSFIPINDGENELVLQTVGKHGKVFVHWPTNLFDSFFNEEEFDKVVDIQSKEDNLTLKTISIEDCISKYCQMEQLEETEMWYCNRCKEHVRAWKQYHLYRTPPILIVHLKRFHFSSFNHRRDKIDSFINFPLKGLDLRREVIYWENGEEPIYDCYAISNHFGGLGGGHYTAYAQSDNGEWCYFDDNKVVTCVDEKEVVSASAYVLYYRRRDVVFND